MCYSVSGGNVTAGLWALTGFKNDTDNAMMHTTNTASFVYFILCPSTYPQSLNHVLTIAYNTTPDINNTYYNTIIH